MVNLSLFDSGFQAKVDQLITIFRDKGHSVSLLSGLRTLEEQARLWRRGRSTYEIQSTIARYRLNGCDFLAETLEKVGPQKENKKCTNALPGTSWHNWGMALDVLIDGKQKGDDPVYQVLSFEAKKLGLLTGYSFPIQDAGHIQMFEYEVPKKYSMQQINDHFRDLQS